MLLAAIATTLPLLSVPASVAADAPACKPAQSAAMLTGPVYDSIVTVCAWSAAIVRRDTAAASRLLDENFVRVDERGRTQSRNATLSALRSGDLGNGRLDASSIDVQFSSGSTNVVIGTWTSMHALRRRAFRVTDVLFCRVTSPKCTYRLVSEQLTPIDSSAAR